MKRIITIGREFGSGGRELGRRIAKKLEIAYYDQEIIAEIAKRTALSEEYIRQIEEMLPILHFPIRTGHRFYLTSEPIFYPDLSIYTKQHELLRELSRKSNCVIVGRCANFILRGRENVLNVFVTAPVVDCVRRVMETDGLNLEEAEKKIKKVDKRRADYFKYFTGREWHDAALYDLCLNTGHMSEQKCVDIVRSYMDARFE